MTDFRGNIDHWLKQSEPDYYLFFLKAWIPFNAWYVAELPSLNKNDSKIIKELQDNVNSKPRLIIENFLTTTVTAESEKFRSHLAELYNHLESKTIRHNGHRLSFKDLTFSENPVTFEKDLDSDGRIFKAERKTSYFEAMIVEKSGKTLMHIKQPIFSIDDFKKNNNFIKIADKKIKTKILACYEAINPNKSISLVSISKNKSDCIALNTTKKVFFINDPTTIAKGCIKVLYALRCMLFHGEIEPTNANKPIYEHSFYLLRQIIHQLN